MKLSFCGATRTVTGSKHLIELQSGKRILLDCGLFQGRRAEADEKNRVFPFDPTTIDVVILSHAHIDHSGLLPKLYSDGFRGRIYCTHATYSLCSLMLLDSAHIQEKDIRFVNKIRKSKGKPAVEPLYGKADAEQVLEHFVGLPYRTEFSPIEGVTLEFRDAGHILGAASVNLAITENGKTIRLGFTGDIGNPGRPILKDPEKMADCDYLITESTYGGKTHEPADLAKKKLAAVVSETSARGGKVIIPAFAVGRTQEIVYALDQLWNEDKLPPIPAFVDSPLAVRATGVYLSHPECYDSELLEYMITDENPFGFERLSYVRDVEKSKELNMSRVPMIIISASGMCEAGRILHHLKNNIEDSRNTVVIVGYCADHTLGKKLVDKLPEVRIFGESYKLRAEVRVMNNYSAHADEPGMIDFLGKMDRDRIKKTFLVHGSYERQLLFKNALNDHGYKKVVIPQYRESFNLS
ncbi:MAG: MBL fold metallo-hydrolase [Rhodothermales bacterium]|nr:MBL fold metallo-hydrolase [Rhodothermales bacterium]